jgi:hypothetical protein
LARGWIALYDVLEHHGIRVVLVNAHTKNVPGRSAMRFMESLPGIDGQPVNVLMQVEVALVCSDILQSELVTY